MRFAETARFKELEDVMEVVQASELSFNTYARSNSGANIWTIAGMVANNRMQAGAEAAMRSLAALDRIMVFYGMLKYSTDPDVVVAKWAVEQCGFNPKAILLDTIVGDGWGNMDLEHIELFKELGVRLSVADIAEIFKETVEMAYDDEELWKSAWPMIKATMELVCLPSTASGLSTIAAELKVSAKGRGQRKRFKRLACALNKHHRNVVEQLLVAHAVLTGDLKMENDPAWLVLSMSHDDPTLLHGALCAIVSVTV